MDFKASEAREAAAEPRNGKSDATTLLQDFSALYEYAGLLLNISLDEVRSRVRSSLGSMFWGLSLYLISGAVAMLCLWYVLDGVAGGVAAAFGGRIWFGRLAAGVMGLGAIMLSLRFRKWIESRRRRRQAMERYESTGPQERADLNSGIQDDNADSSS